MMKKNIIVYFLLALTLGFGFSSCEDMLTGDMDRHVEVDEIAQDTLYSYWGILRSLQNVAERYVILGECRGDLVDGTQYVSDSINSILEFGLTGDASDGSNRYLKAADFYHIINSCNAYIYRCDTAEVSGLNKSLMLSEYSQVVTIRAWAYLQLVLNYGRVPYFETPMLSTADMEDFRKAEKYVDANTLASSGVAQKVEEVLYVPTLLRGDSIRGIPYPDYEYYGRTKIIAYASQCIFPQDLVLGDIYLLRAQGEGSEADYRAAAKHYYNFLNSDKGGPLLPNEMYGTMSKSMRTEQYSLQSSDGWMYMFAASPARTSTSHELVTLIPSNTNKLWGTVLRGINELFGFDATLSVSTSAKDTVTSASVSLERNFEHQLDASKAYKALNKAQNYEAYIGPEGNERCTVLVGAGDARYEMATNNYVDYDKGAQEEINFVMKQNPGGAFTTTYPCIYRKANIWLRFAQALNGAGFPGYAFAILRHGLVGTEGWVPVDENDYIPDRYRYYDVDEIDPITGDTVFYETAVDFRRHIYQRALAEETVFEADEATIELYFKLYAGESVEITEEEYDAVIAFSTELSAYVTANSKSFWQQPVSYSQIPEPGYTVCDYISRREMENAKKAPFLNFNTVYLRGSNSNNRLSMRYGVTEYQINSLMTYTNSAGAVSMGIHQRGCGILRWTEHETTFNYVDQINKMLQLYEGQEESLTEAEIYDPENLRTVQVAIADLIIDEMALETSFEGNRFFDLLCYSRFLGGQKGVERFAKRVSERGGTPNAALYSHLQNQSNWYFKLP